jgi:hypothetical protein
MSTWMSTQTSAGMLFEVDLRLRPNGDSGMLVSPIEAFRDYQMQHAWVWEHQALTRARFCAGDPAVGEQFEAIRIEVLCQARDLATLRDEVLAMRQRMLDQHASGSEESFDIKHDRGGLIDVEFIVQYLILGHAHAASPALRQPRQHRPARDRCRTGPDSGQSRRTGAQRLPRVSPHATRPAAQRRPSRPRRTRLGQPPHRSRARTLGGGIRCGVSRVVDGLPEEESCYRGRTKA